MKLLNHICYFILALFSCCNAIPAPTEKHESNDKIAVDFSKSDWIPLKVTLQNKDSGIFLLDNGTSDKLYIDEEFAKGHNYLLDLKYRSDSSYYYSNYLDKRPYIIKFGNLSDTSHQTVIFNLSKQIGAKIDGLIGHAFLNKYILYINYKEHYVQFFSNSDIIDQHKYEGIKLTKSKSFPRFPVSLWYKGITIEDSAILDLGYSSSTLFIGGQTVKRHHLKLDSSKLTRGGIFVAGERNVALIDTIDSLKISESSYIKSVKAEFSKSTIKQGPSGQDMILIGNGVLKQKYDNLYIDFVNSMLYLPK